MRAIHLKELVESVDELNVSTLPDLAPAKDRYVVQVLAAGTNFFDILQVQGKHQEKHPLPFNAGNEFAGYVLKTPVNSSNPLFKAGANVFGAELGAFATQIYVKEESLRSLPSGWTPLQASGLFYTAPTAYAALVERAHALPGD
jgi:NADPH2:quinone reductase